MAAAKNYTGSQKFNFPEMGQKLHIPLFSEDLREEFLLDVRTMRIDFSKCSLQNRVRKSIVLARLDLGNSVHRNPDKTVVTGNHIHIYKEGFDDKFAYPLPQLFVDCRDSYDFLEKFMDYCNVKKKPIIERGLF